MNDAWDLVRVLVNSSLEFSCPELDLRRHYKGWRADSFRLPPFLVFCVLSRIKAHVLTLHTAHVLPLNKANVLALKKEHALRLNNIVLTWF